MEEQAYFLEGLRGIPRAQWQAWLGQLPSFRREAALRYRYEADQLCSVAAFCLLSVALGQIPHAFVYSESGKPQPIDGMAFNLSHSEDCVAVAVSREAVGVDIESMRSAPMEVCPRVFTPWEREQIQAPDADRAFFQLWTAKESYIKRSGEGLRFPLQTLELTLRETIQLQEGAVISLLGTAESQAAVCASGPMSFREISASMLAEEWRRLVGAP